MTEKQIFIQAILEVLKAAKEPLTINELSGAIASRGVELPTRRSIQRYLKEEQEVLAQKAKHSNELLYSYRPLSILLVGQTIDSDGIKEKPSALALNATAKLYKRFCNHDLIKILKSGSYALGPKVYYNYEVLRSYDVNDSSLLNTNAIGRLEKLLDHKIEQMPGGTYAKIVLSDLLIDIAYNSSRLEHESITFLDTKELLEGGKKVENLSDIDKAIILNHKRAIEFLVEISDRKLTSMDIRTLHAFLSEDLLANPSDSGSRRGGPIYIEGAAYQPLAADQNLQIEFDEIVRKASLIENVFERAFFTILMLSYLQFFIDVNKRTARISANHAFILNNLPPISFKGISKEDYNFALLCFYEKNDTEPMEILFEIAYINSIDQYKTTLGILGPIDPLRIKYRNEKNAIIGELIRNEIPQSQEVDFIKLKLKNVTSDKTEVMSLMRIIITDLNAVNEAKLFALGVSNESYEKWSNVRKTFA